MNGQTKGTLRKFFVQSAVSDLKESLLGLLEELREVQHDFDLLTSTTQAILIITDVNIANKSLLTSQGVEDCSLVDRKEIPEMPTGNKDPLQQLKDFIGAIVLICLTRLESLQFKAFDENTPMNETDQISSLCKSLNAEVSRHLRDVAGKETIDRPKEETQELILALLDSISMYSKAEVFTLQELSQTEVSSKPKKPDSPPYSPRTEEPVAPRPNSEKARRAELIAQNQKARKMMDGRGSTNNNSGKTNNGSEDSSTDSQPKFGGGVVKGNRRSTVVMGDSRAKKGFSDQFDMAEKVDETKPDSQKVEVEPSRMPEPADIQIPGSMKRKFTVVETEEQKRAKDEAQAKEDAMQDQIEKKFNLEDRMRNTSSLKLSESGVSANRLRRRAAIFEKSTDRYSQMHSNLEQAQSNGDEVFDELNIYEEEKTNNIKFVTNEDGTIEVTHGTLNQLVKYLTSAKNIDSRYLQTFLLTYTSFTTPKGLFEKLKQRYAVPSSTPPEAAKKKQLRVVNTLKKCKFPPEMIEPDNQGLDLSFLDFNDELISSIFEFVEELKSDGNSSFAALIDNVLLTKLVGVVKKVQEHQITSPPSPIIPKGSVECFADMDPLELARQWTLLDQEVYSAIRASELLNQAWNKPTLKHRSPRLLTMIKRFNQLSMFVAGEIVRVENLKERAKIYQRWIDTAFNLRELHNYNGLMAVLSGLQNSAVWRLNATKEEISKASEKKLEKLQTMMESKQNFANYKVALKASKGSVIPYLLTFIEDGNRDSVDGLINFKKRKLVAKVIGEIQNYQVGKKYNLVPVDSIKEFLSNLPEENDTDLYNLSLVREPRKPQK